MIMRVYLFILILLIPFLGWAQSSKVTGIVKDNTGELIPGVTIVEKGFSNGVITDIDGKFAITLNSANSVLVISYIGYKKQEIPVTGGTSVTVVLSQDVVELNELVVIGYGAVPKSNVLGAIASVTGKEMGNQSVQSLEQALQGKMSGVEITSNSGAPGADVSIKIRGMGTINNSDPLFVVDGIITNTISNISPSDIKSVETLKDAASAAVYGSRGANGVIIITTKSGETGKPKVDISYRYSANSFGNVIEVMQGDDYISYLNSAKQLDVVSLGTKSYNWMDMITNGSAFNQDINCSVSGGTDKYSYYVSFNNLTNKGIILNSDFARNNATLKFDTKLSDKLKLSFKTFYAGTNTSKIPLSPSGVIRRALTNSPVLLYDSNYPFLYDTESPLYAVNNQITHVKDNTITIATGLDYDMMKNLKFTSNFSYRISSSNDDYMSPRAPQYDYVYNTPITEDVAKTEIKGNMSQNNYYLWDNILSYNNSFGLHNLALTGVATVESYNGIKMYGKGYTIFGNNENNAVFNSTSPFLGVELTGDRDINRSVGFVGRASYNFSKKYLFEALFRADGSSKFSDENRWGYFPSLSGGWRISEEEFMKRFAAIDQLKVRASWGKVGNDRIPNNVQYTILNPGAFYTYGTQSNYYNVDGIYTKGIGNTKIEWEKTSTVTLGVDFAFFKKFSGSVDFFERYTTDMLLAVPTPLMTGFDEGNRPYQNGGDVKNSGFEFNIDYTQKITRDLNFKIGGNFSKYKNRVMALGKNDDPVWGGSASYGSMGYLTKTEVGNEIGAFYGYITDGVYTSTDEVLAGPQKNENAEPTYLVGCLKFVDLSGDGIIDDKDKTYIGSPHADFTYGMNLSVNYKSLTFGMAWYGVYGNEIFDASMYYLSSAAWDNGTMSNIRADLKGKFFNDGTKDKKYQPINTSADAYPSLFNESKTQSNFNNRPSDYFIKDGSFLRLKNISLSYSLPEKMCNTLKVRSLMLTLGGQNLLTFTKYDGFDPEIGKLDGQEGNNINWNIDYGTYPQARSVFVGVNIGF